MYSGTLGCEAGRMALTCLIVDDSKEFLASAARLFAPSSIQVVGLASTGADAQRLVAVLTPDVTLVDVELGDEDGIELARQLTAAGSGTRVILISLRDRGELAELIAGSGAVGFLRKDALGEPAITDIVGGIAR
jgi:two-component system, NarL family, nitrate/nitrite response regulator NarL